MKCKKKIKFVYREELKGIMNMLHAWNMNLPRNYYHIYDCRVHINPTNSMFSQFFSGSLPPLPFLFVSMHRLL